MSALGDDDSTETRHRLERVAAGEDAAWRALVAPHHDRLRRMVALRLDPRLQGRIDPSDVLQETYLEAVRQLAVYLRNPVLPFFLWLRQLADTAFSSCTAATSAPRCAPPAARCRCTAAPCRRPPPPPWLPS